MVCLETEGEINCGQQRGRSVLKRATPDIKYGIVARVPTCRLFFLRNPRHFFPPLETDVRIITGNTSTPEWFEYNGHRRTERIQSARSTRKTSARPRCTCIDTTKHSCPSPAPWSSVCSIGNTVCRFGAAN